jgi:hypothetical protein
MDDEVSTVEDQRVKCEVIAAFFDNAEARIAFLSELDRAGHGSEAMTLCLTYIESFSQWLRWPRSETGWNFVEAVIQFGGDEMMGLAHPLQAVDSYQRMGEPWPTLANLVERVFPGPPYEILPMAAFESTLAANLTTVSIQPQQLRNETWRATIANTAYQRLRNPSVHAFGSSDGIYFSETTFRGSPVPPLTLPSLVGVVRGLVREARRRSEANGQWFGDDRIVKGDPEGE